MVADAELTLASFGAGDAHEIESWVTDLSEAQAWAGPGLSSLPDASSFEAWHQDPDVHPNVLRRDRTLLGYGEIWVDRAEQEIELARIIVKPSQRGRGIGGTLVRLLLHEAAGFGLDEAFVRVVPENAPAIRCYERAGFSRVSLREERRFNRNQPVAYAWMRHELGRGHA